MHAVLEALAHARTLFDHPTLVRGRHDPTVPGSSAPEQPSNRAVPGMICIIPIAPALLTAQNLYPDSCAITASSKVVGIPCSQATAAIISK